MQINKQTSKQIKYRRDDTLFIYLFIYLFAYLFIYLYDHLKKEGRLRRLIEE